MDVTINFVFANFEKKVIVSTNTRATGGDLKNLLYSNWPGGTSSPQCIPYVLLMPIFSAVES
jgi:hypothetical protein